MKNRDAQISPGTCKRVNTRETVKPMLYAFKAEFLTFCSPAFSSPLPVETIMLDVFIYLCFHSLFSRYNWFTRILLSGTPW